MFARGCGGAGLGLKSKSEAKKNRLGLFGNLFWRGNLNGANMGETSSLTKSRLGFGC